MLDDSKKLIEEILDEKKDLSFLKKGKYTVRQLDDVFDCYQDFHIRKMIINDPEKIKKIEKIEERILQALNIMNSCRKPSNTNNQENEVLDDTDLFFQVVLNLVNKENNQYDLRIFSADDKRVKSNNNNKPKIFVLAKKSALFDIDASKDYPKRSFTPIAIDILKSHSSMLIMTRNGFNTIIDIPLRNELERKDIITDGNNSNIYCYLYDDELGKVMEKVFKYTDVYGWDISKNRNRDFMSEIDNNQKGI